VKKTRNISVPFFLILGLHIIFLNTCKKGPSVSDLLTGTKWQVTDYCGTQVSNYTWTFKPTGQLIEIEDTTTYYWSWSLKNNDKNLVIGSSEKTIISLTETKFILREPGGFLACSWTFKSVPF
jgi:hypothetical protein